MDVIEEWIWFYHKNGFSIIPLGKNASDDPKKPSLPTWEKYQKTQATEEEIRQWIEGGLFKNIGIICGAVSNNLVVIDIDAQEIPEKIGLKLDKIAETGAWVVETGKGYHIYLRHDANPGGILKPLKLKIEYRANRGYVVAPPSIHPNGKQYTFMGISKKEDLKQLEIKDAKNIFNELSDKIREVYKIEKPQKTNSYKKNTQELNGYPKCVEIALNTITKHPMRYETFYGLASSFNMQNIPKDMAIKRIKQFNMEKCIPPHDKEKVETAVDGAYNQKGHKYGCEFWIDSAEICPYENIGECPFGDKKLKRDLAKEYKIFNYTKKKNKDTGEEYYAISGVNPIRLARLILNEFDYNFVTIKDNKDIYYYNGGIYHPEGDTLIAEIAQDFMEDQTTKHLIEEVVSYIKNNNYFERNIFDTNIDLIGLENGVYSIKTKQLTDYKPEYYLTSIIPIKYDKDAKCPQWIEFLQDVCYLEDIPFLQEIIGYCFYRRYLWAILIILVGFGRNGKTTFINTISKLLGDDNVTHLPLQLLAHDTFAKSKLYHKWANLCADIGQEEIRRTGIIKELTGGDPQYARDLYQTGFNFINHAKLIFAANVLPECKDNTFAMKERFAIIEFPNSFPRGDPKCDPYLIDKLTTELPGIFNWALEGLERLMEKKNFSPYRDLEEVTRYKAEERNPIRQFIMQYLDSKADGEIVKDVLYRTYLKFAHDNKFPTIASNFFSSQLKQHIPHDWTLEEGQPRKTGHKTTWKGIWFKDNELNGKDGKDENQTLSLY